MRTPRKNTVSQSPAPGYFRVCKMRERVADVVAEAEAHGGTLEFENGVFFIATQPNSLNTPMPVSNKPSRLNRLPSKRGLRT